MPMTGGTLTGGLALGLGAIASAAATMTAQVAGGPEISNGIQYGALGLCAILVAGLMFWLRTLYADLQKSNATGNERAEAMHQRTLRVIDAHTDALKSRPCLFKDRIFDKARKDQLDVLAADDKEQGE